MNIFFQKPKRVVYFCQYYNEKGLKVDFVSLPAWQWIVLADHFSVNESAHMKSLFTCVVFSEKWYLWMYDSLWTLWPLCTSITFFYVISLWFIGDEQRSQKEKWEESCACFINQVRAGWFFVFAAPLIENSIVKTIFKKRAFKLKFRRPWLSSAKIDENVGSALISSRIRLVLFSSYRITA